MLKSCGGTVRKNSSNSPLCTQTLTKFRGHISQL